MQKVEHVQYHSSVKPQAYLQSSEFAGLVTICIQNKTRVNKTRVEKKCWGLALTGVKCLKAKGTYLKLVQQIVVECFLFSTWSLSQWFSHLFLWTFDRIYIFTDTLTAVSVWVSWRQVSVILDGITTWNQELPASCHVKHFPPCGVLGGALCTKKDNRMEVKVPLYLQLIK